MALFKWEEKVVQGRLKKDVMKGSDQQLGLLKRCSLGKHCLASMSIHSAKSATFDDEQTKRFLSHNESPQLLTSWLISAIGEIIFL